MRAALKLALEALERIDEAMPFPVAKLAQKAIKEALAQPAVAEQHKQEPVACIEDGDLYFANEIDWQTLQKQGFAVQLLYTTPPQPEQEPVALRHSFDGYGYLYTDMGFGSGWIEWTKRSHKDAEPLYTTPPQRTWVGLTDEEIDVAIKAAKKVDTGYAGWVRDQRKEYAIAIEAKLKEKNT